MRLLSLLMAYFGQYAKRQMSYRFNFWMQAIALVGWSLVNLSLVHLVFQQVKTIEGWTLGEALLIYGLAQTSFGLSFVFGCNLMWLPSRYIVEGQFDRVLVRPLNPYLQMMMEEMSIEDLIFTSIGVLVMRHALHLIGIPIDLRLVLTLIVMVISAAIVWVSVLTIGASLSFWFKDRGTLIWPLIETADQVSRYPLTIYPTGVRLFFTLLLPIGFMGFYPAQSVLGRPEWAWAGWATPFVACLLAAIGYGIFRLGLSSYESTGS